MTYIATRRAAQSRLWAPKDLGSSLCLWLDANDLNTIVLNGSNVSTWRDKSGYNNDVSQSTGASQPGFVVSSGNNSLSFNGTSQVLAGNAAGNGLNNFPFGSAPRYVFAFITPASGISAGSILEYGNGAPTGQNGNGFMVLCDASYSRWLSTNNFDVKASGSPGTSQQLYSLLYSNGNVALSTNGTQVANAAITATTVNYNILHIGGSYWASGNNNYYKGNIGAIVMVNGFLTSALVAKIEGWMMWSRGAQGGLSGSHQYRAQPPLVAA